MELCRQMGPPCQKTCFSYLPFMEHIEGNGPHKPTKIRLKKSLQLWELLWCSLRSPHSSPRIRLELDWASKLANFSQYLQHQI